MESDVGSTSGFYPIFKVKLSFLHKYLCGSVRLEVLLIALIESAMNVETAQSDQCTCFRSIGTIITVGFYLKYQAVTMPIMI